MEEKFDFKFDLNQEVVTPFGDDGLVEMLGFDGGGRKYYVQTAKNLNWFKECQLEEQVSVCTVTDFLGTVCQETDGECMTSAKEVYAAFADYCKGNGWSPMSHRRFAHKIGSLGQQRTRRGGTYYWLGISLPKAA